jgi:DNA recombination protein RmuC
MKFGGYMTTEMAVIFGTGIFILLFLLVLITIVAVLFFQLRKIQNNKGEVFQLLPQLAIVTEKLSHIEPVTQAMNLLQADVRGLGERIGKVESNQGLVGQGINYLANDVRGLGERIATVEKNQGIVNQNVGFLATNTLSAITELKSLTTGLNDTTGAMRVELSRANNDLTELHTHVRAEQESERQIAESIRRLETVIAGTQTKGSAGENVLEVVFSKLPIEWQVRDFKIGGKSVEFALRLPNNLIMPIDSKWAATNLLEQFFNAEDLQEQQRLKKAIEDIVLLKAKEVKKYLDPSITVNFGVAVVPDAVYDLCTGIQAETFQLNVVLVSYSMFVPYLLLVFQTTLKNSQSIDLQKLDAYLQTAQESIKNLQDELDGRFSRAITMMNNSRDDMRAVLGKLGGSLTGLQMGAGSVPSLQEPTEKMLESGSSITAALT